MGEAAEQLEPTRRLSPLRDLVHVRRVYPKTSAGGVILLHHFRAKNSPRLTLGAQGDYWPAIVLAVGPQTRDLAAGDRVLVYNFADDTGSKLGLYAGTKLGDDEYLVGFERDIVCAVEDAGW